jgi:hypothetical protein
MPVVEEEEEGPTPLWLGNNKLSKKYNNFN